MVRIGGCGPLGSEGAMWAREVGMDCSGLRIPCGQGRLIGPAQVCES